MRSHRRRGRFAVVVPALVGCGLLGGGILLLPGQREVLHAERRAMPPVDAPVRVRPVIAPPLPVAIPTPPTLAAVIATADAAGLATTTARLIAAGQPVSTVQVAHDLVAAGRASVALDYLAARPDGAGPATWGLRFDLLRQSGRGAEAAALVTDAARIPGRAVAAELIAAGYALDRPDLIVAAAGSGAIPPPDVALALDLARRADAAGRFEWIATLDRATRADWRGRDPWLALRVAARTHDTEAGLRAAGRLPADQRDAARETILTAAGDRAALRKLILARAAVPGAVPGPLAEQLLAAGWRDDAIAILRRAATGRPPAASERLLYLMGPRPAAADVAWLRQQTQRGTLNDRLAWIGVYAERDRPGDAQAFLARHPLAARTEVMLTRLALAQTAGDPAAGRAIVAGLLDGRPLDGAQLRALSAAAPAGIAPAQAGAIARERIAAGVADRRDRLDLAWTAWNAGDARGAAGWLDPHLKDDPSDPVAIRLMADVQARLGGARAARPWLERALALTPPDSRARAELLDRLGRRGEAVALVEGLRAAAPADRSLAALHARLLIAQGQPGRARAVLAK